MPRTSTSNRRIVRSKTVERVNLSAVKQKAIPDDGCQDVRELLTLPEANIKHESGLTDEKAVKQEANLIPSILGKRPRLKSSVPYIIKEEEEEEEEEDNNDDNDDDEKDHTNDKNTESPNVRPSTKESREAASKNKSHSSRYDMTRKRYQQELKALPDPKHLTKYARLADYEACKSLATFLGEEFEHEREERLKKGCKLKKANATTKALKIQLREAETELRGLKDNTKKDATTKLLQLPSEVHIKLERANVQYKQDLIDLRAELQEQREKRMQTYMMVAREKEESEKLAAQLKARDEARESSEQKVTDLKQKVIDLEQVLAMEKQRRSRAQSTIDELVTTKTSYDNEIQALKVEVNRMTHADATRKAASEFREAALQEKCRNLETDAEELRKKYDEQKQRFESRINQIFGELRDSMQTQE